jgi:DNA-binding response OmpR family regulator
MSPTTLLQKTVPVQSNFVVAVVEDDQLLRQELEVHLRANQFTVYGVSSGAALNDLITAEPIDMFIIDLNLPGEGGLSICKRLRQALPNSGIVIMTGRVALHDRLAGYSHGGADFYLTKPVSPDELVLVLLSLGKRVKKISQAGEWNLSVRDRILLGPDPWQKLRLTSREKTFLVALSHAKDHTLESGALCDLFSAENVEVGMSKHALEELIARLRKKFKSVQTDGAEPAIKSVWGIGYQLCVPITLVY